MFSRVWCYHRTMTAALATVAPIHNVEAIAATLDSSVAESTLRAYRIAQDAQVEYFGARGWDLYPSDATEAGEYVGRVLSFLQSKADDGQAVSSINRTLAGVKWHASRESQLGFMVLNASREVKAWMAGLTRQHKGDTKRQAQAFSLDDLRGVHKALGRRRTVRNLRNRAIIAMGVATALRAQSLADLNLSDVTKALTVDGLNIRVRWSKTDQDGEGRTITVKRAKAKALDPVAIIEAWLGYLAAMGLTPEATPDVPLFPHVRGRSVQVERMSNASATITDVVRGAAASAGLDSEAYSSHSLRATFTTLSYAAGVPESRIADVTGHKNMNIMRGYDRTASEQVAQSDYLGG